MAENYHNYSQNCPVASPHNAVVTHEVDTLLQQTPSYHALDYGTQQALRDSLSKVAGYLAGGGQSLSDGPFSGQMAGVDQLRQQLGGGGQQQPQNGGMPPSQQDPSAQPQQPASGAAPAPSSGGGGSPTARVGDVAKATLNAIDFPSFVSSLIKGTFQAIVDASIQQMEAYAELLKNVASTVDDFMTDHVSEGNAKDYLADKYDGVLTRDSSGGKPVLKVSDSAPDEMPSFFKGLGIQSPQDIDQDAIDNKIVPAARRSMAEQRQQTLATMVLLGINRIVVDNGEITAKLQFHIDASESMTMKFDQKKQTAGNMASTGGRSPFTANAIMVNTATLNTQSDINVRADLTGQVKVIFRSETFPLARFADSNAIQLINSNAKVPEQTPAPAAVGAPVAVAPVATAPVAVAPVAAAPVAAIPAPAPAPAPAAPPAPAPTTGQSLGTNDPWAPRPRAWQ